MYECVNPSHPDKVADRIAGAIVDIAYKKERCPKIAVEVLIGHGLATIIAETSVPITRKEVKDVVLRLANIKKVKFICVPQDARLASNQAGHFRCGDNGIFKGVPTSHEELELVNIAKEIYFDYPYDGKYVFESKTGRFIICQSNAARKELVRKYPDAEINPIGDWTGGSDVDSGATNRKLGSDMGRCVSGGGLHGKDLSKADVSVNIYAFLKAQKTGKPVELCCAIGDEFVDNKPFGEIAAIARAYIKECGGFEKFAEWGLLGGPNPSDFFGLIN